MRFVRKVGDVLARLDQKPQWQEALDEAVVSRFVPAATADYEPIMAMYQDVKGFDLG